MSPIGIIMAEQHRLFWPITWCVLIGGICGDLISFFVGKWYSNKISFKNYPKLQSLQEKGQFFFKKYGVFGIFVGRFLGPIRSSVPFIAGGLQMDTLKFLLIVPPTVIVWMIIYLSPGYILGMYQKKLFFGDLYLILALIFVVAVITLLLMRYKNTLPYKPLKWCSPGQTLLIYNISINMLMLMTLSIVVAHTPIFEWLNHVVLAFLRTFESNASNHIATIGFAIGNKAIVIPSVLLFITICIIRKNLQQAAYWFIGMSISILLIAATKLGINSPRPILSQGLGDGHSFISGHVTLITWLAYTLNDKTQIFKKYYVLCPLMVCITAFGRLYLGMHWMSDIVGGLLAGLMAYQLATLFESYGTNTSQEKTSALWLVVPIVIYTMITHHQSNQKHNAMTNEFFYNNTPWLQPPHWVTPYGSVPLVRYSSIGLRGDYLNIHGTNIESFKEQLEQYQWNIHPVNTTVFERLQDLFDGQDTIVLLSYLNGAKPITMASKGQCRIEVWADKNTSLWHGTIHHKQKYQSDLCDVPLPSFVIDTQMTDMTHWDNIIALYTN